MREPGRPGWTRGGGVTLPAVRRGGGGGPRGESWEDNIQVWGAWEGAKSPVDEQCRARLDSEVVALVPSCETRLRPVRRIVLPWRPWCRGLCYFGLYQRHPDPSFLWCSAWSRRIWLDLYIFWQWSPTLPCCSLACEHLSDPGRVDHIRLCVILNCVYFVQHQERTNKKNTDTTSTVRTWRCAEARRSNSDASERAQCL